MTVSGRGQTFSIPPRMSRKHEVMTLRLLDSGMVDLACQAVVNLQEIDAAGNEGVDRAARLLGRVHHVFRAEPSSLRRLQERTGGDEPLRWGDPERFERGGSRPYLAASFWNGAICPAVQRFRGDVVMEFTDTRVCAMRGIGGVATAFARECFVDEMVHETGTDPLEYRRMLFEGQPESQLVFDTLKERCNWDGRPGLGCAMGSASYALAVEIDLDERTGVVKPTKIWAVASYAVVVEPNNAENSFYGQLMLYVGASTSEEITFRDGKQEQSNFHNFQIARMADVPEIDVHVIPSESRRIGTADGPAYAIGPAISRI